LCGEWEFMVARSDVELQLEGNGIVTEVFVDSVNGGGVRNELECGEFGVKGRMR
jgi:hypothetical protein